MKQGIVAPIPTGYQMSPGVKVVLEATQKLDPGQQITVLRNTVVDMGFDTSELGPSSSRKSAEPIAEPLFERTEPATINVKIEGIDEPAVLKYVEAMNADNFDAAVQSSESWWENLEPRRSCSCGGTLPQVRGYGCV